MVSKFTKGIHASGPTFLDQSTQEQLSSFPYGFVYEVGIALKGSSSAASRPEFLVPKDVSPGTCPLGLIPHPETSSGHLDKLTAFKYTNLATSFLLLIN